MRVRAPAAGPHLTMGRGYQPIMRCCGGPDKEIDMHFISFVGSNPGPISSRSSALAHGNPLLHHNRTTARLTFAFLLISMFFLVAQSKSALSGRPVLRSSINIHKRQSQYQPGSLYCGIGDTCTEACGPSFEQCSSNDGVLHCYVPSAG